MVSHLKLVFDANRGLIVRTGVDNTTGMQRGELPRICYVDDSGSSTFVTRKVLDQFGYHVSHFNHGDAALEVLLSQPFDLLLLDFNAAENGGLNGEHLIRILRASGHPQNSIIPIVALLGNNEPESAGQLKQIGANAVFTKPIKGRELDHSMRELIERYRAAIGASPLNKSAASESNDMPSSTSAHEGRTANRAKKTFTQQELAQRFSGAATIAAGQGTEEVSAQPSPPKDIPILENAVGIIDTAQIAQENSKEKLELATVIDARAVDYPPARSQVDGASVIDARAVVVAEPHVIHRSVVSARAVEPAYGGENSSAPPVDNQLLSLLEKLEQGPVTAGGNPFKSPQSLPLSSGAKSPWAGGGQKGLFKKVAIGAGLVLLAVIAVKKWSPQESDSFNVVLAERGPIYESISVPAKVVSKRLAEVTSYSAGQVVKIEVKEGENVTKGQVLALMDEREAQSLVNRVHANLLSAQEEVLRTGKNLERLQRALELGAVSRQRVEDAEGDWRAANARKSVNEEELRAAQLALERLQIVAPFNGVVTAISAHAGKWIAPPEPIVTVVDISAQEVVAKVDASDAAIIQVGQEVMLSNESFAGKKWKETVTRIAAATKRENASNNIDVAITLGSDAPQLRVGQQVDAEIRLRGNPDAIKVPVQALVNNSGTPSLPVLRNGKVHFVQVVTGIEDIASVEIVRGLEDGEQVVVAGGKELTEGQRIRIVGGG